MADLASRLNALPAEYHERRIGVRIAQRDDRRLVALARQHRVTRSELLRLAIADLLASEPSSNGATRRRRRRPIRA